MTKLSWNQIQRLTFLNSIVYPTILEKVNKKHAQRNEKFISSHRMLKADYPTGSQVMIKDEMRTDKASPRYEGPFTILRRESSGNYRLKGADGTEYSRPPQVLKLANMGIAKEIILPNTIFAAVKEIIEHKEIGNDIYYRTRWKDHGPELDSWLRKEDFLDYGPLQRYERGGNKKKEEVFLQPNLKVARAGQKKMVRFDQSVRVSGNGYTELPSRKPVESATEANLNEDGCIELPSREPVESATEAKLEEDGYIELPSRLVKSDTEPEISKTTEVLLDLDSRQHDAIGKYWKSMRESRKKEGTDSRIGFRRRYID